MSNFRENGDVPSEARGETFSGTRYGQPRIRNVVSSSDHGDAPPPFVPVFTSDGSKGTPPQERKGREGSDTKGPPGPPDEPTSPPSGPASEGPDGLDSYILSMQQGIAQDKPLPRDWNSSHVEDNKTEALGDAVKIVQHVLGDESITHHNMVSAVREAGLSVDDFERGVAGYTSEGVNGASVAETTRVQQYITASREHGMDSPEAERARERMGPVNTFAGEHYTKDGKNEQSPDETSDSDSDSTHDTNPTNDTAADSHGDNTTTSQTVHIGDVYNPPPGYQAPDVHIGRVFVGGVEQPQTTGKTFVDGVEQPSTDATNDEHNFKGASYEQGYGVQSETVHITGPGDVSVTIIDGVVQTPPPDTTKDSQGPFTTIHFPGRDDTRPSDGGGEQPPTQDTSSEQPDDQKEE